MVGVVGLEAELKGEARSAGAVPIPVIVITGVVVVVVVVETIVMVVVLIVDGVSLSRNGGETKNSEDGEQGEDFIFHTSLHC